MLTVDALKKNIKNKNTSPIYLIWGTELYLAEEAIQAISSLLAPDERDFNLSVHNLDEIAVQEVMEDAETMPFLGDRRIVVMKNAAFLTAAKEKAKIEHDIKVFEQYILNPAEYTTLVVVVPYEKLDERKKIVKQLKSQAEIIQVSQLSNDTAEKWLYKEAQSLNVSIETDAAELLLSRLGTKMSVLAKEMEKMALFVGNEGTITRETVDELVARTLEDDVFALVDHVVHKRTEAALRSFYDLMKQNQEPIQIHALITRQFRIINGVKELQKKGYGEKQIASALKLHPYAVKLASKHASQFDESFLRNSLDEFAETDYKMKTGQMDKTLLLEMEIIKLSQAKQSNSFV
ncbi:DNA polymerase III subunit delta [Fictibacillus phosphorivorans]|uniref:DNA polymerase III subunit delta n=1 Tax=Fictibacillus phosphorivorans TaxID=1221500 RepID=UPI002040CDC2|nr:DNA polymerase III subunit delta [Fictibacillus phosphorivorans]MCM3774563.1 DNA polymerase III subunit delta [Fictibacillus phosphorivorans]